MTALVPYVVEKHGRDERAMDIYSRLLKDRIIILGSGVNDDVANSIVAQLLFLQFDDPKADIHFYVNSPGGSITAGMAIYDTMQYIRAPVATLCIGQAASMGSLLLTGGEKGMRGALPNASIMVHQPSGGYQGQATDILIHAQFTEKLKRRLNEIYVKHTGQDYDAIHNALERDRFLTPEEAKEFGLIDQIYEKRAVPDTPA